MSVLLASVLRDVSSRTRLGRRSQTITTSSLASLHSTQLAGLTLTLFSPRSTKCNRDPVSPLIVGGGRILVEFPIRACALAAANVAMPRETTCAHQPLPPTTSSASQQPRAQACVDRAKDEDLYPGCRLLRLRCGRAFGDPPHAAPCLQTEPYPNAVKMQGAQTAWQEEAASP